jgi:hypothetical protein
MGRTDILNGLSTIKTFTAAKFNYIHEIHAIGGATQGPVAFPSSRIGFLVGGMSPLRLGLFYQSDHA